MAQKKYVFLQKVDPDRLGLEIRSSAIVTALDYIYFEFPEKCEVYFKNELTSNDYSLLNSIMAAHVPTPLGPDEDILKTADKRIITKESVRPVGSNGYVTSVDDDPALDSDVGGGPNLLKFERSSGQDNPYVIDHRFNVENNRTWLHEGTVFWEGALFDEFTFEIRPVVTPVLTGQTGTDYNMVSGLIVPAAPGTGTVALQDPAVFFPVKSVLKTDTGRLPTSFWDFAYDAATRTYSGMTPKPNGDGHYNLFGADIVFKRYLNRVVLRGAGKLYFPSSDPSEIGSNIRLLYKFKTVGEEHSWNSNVVISMFRVKTA